jgi:hypothetical protein
VKYIRVAAHLSASGYIRHFGASIFSTPSGQGYIEQNAHSSPIIPQLDGIPTKGYVPVGYSVWDITNKTMRWNSFRWETTVSGALAAAATSVTVTTIGTVADGDVVGILLEDDTTHWTSVSSLSGSTFTIDAIPVGASVSDGARIVFNRWTS